jgi:methylphosphotriester-DNA--protein-cysteine methyltransferase
MNLTKRTELRRIPDRGSHDWATITQILDAGFLARRHCEKEFGYGAKTLNRIVRIQTFMDPLRAHPSWDLTSSAAAAGYADQAHLTREARRLTGLTPVLIREQLVEERRSRRVRQTNAPQAEAGHSPLRLG